MIHLLHGKDDYRVRHAAREIRDKLRASDDMLDSNTTTLDGAAITPQELLAHATAVPFLASNRLVIVEGLLRAIGSERGGRRKKTDDDPLAPWRAAVVTLGDAATMPPTTTLIFVEGDLAKTNQGFAIFAPIARAQEFPLLSTGELPDWISRRAGEKGVRLAPRALAALAQLIGPDLWTMDNELDKLAAIAEGALVEPELIADAVSAAQETKVWDLTDAIVAGEDRKALASLGALLSQGEPVQMLQFMIARQFRQLLLVKDLRERGVRADEVARGSGVPAFRLSAVGAIASRYTWPVLQQAYRRILEADLSVKRGQSGDEAALQLLVHELCASAPAGGRAPARAARR